MSKKDKGDLALEAASATGALIGLSLSFTALSPLVIGGIIGFSSIATFFILAARSLDVGIPKGKKNLILGCIVMISAPITATVIGVALGAAINPGIMLNVWTATLAGAVIGMIGVMSASFAERYIVGPVIEKIAECFSKEAHV